MAKSLVTAIELRLKDGFSKGIQSAGKATAGFAKDTIGAVTMVDNALSGTAAKLTAFGATLSVGAATKDMIALDHRLTRIGLAANASSQQIAAIKQKIYETAMAPDIKIDPDPIIDAFDVIMERVGDLGFADANLRNIALAFQASGESGEAIGNAFSALADIGYSAEETLRFLDNLSAIGDKGAFTLGAFADKAPSIISAYSQIGTSVADLTNAEKALQIMMRGIGSEDETVTALRSTITELNTKEDALLKMGIRVRNQETGKLRDLNDIMEAVAARIETKGNAKEFFEIFGAESMRTVLAFATYAKDMHTEFEKLGDTTGSLERKSATMSKTLQSNLQTLQTAFNRFADSSLTKPISAVTELLNKLAQDPENIERIFEAIAKGLIAITAVKGIAGISRLIGSLGQLKSGNVSISESLSMASAMPVYVTNWGGGVSMPPGVGTGSATGTPGTRPGGLLDQYGNPLPVTSTSTPKGPLGPSGKPSKSPRGKIPKGLKALGAAALAADVAFEGYQLHQELQDIKNSELTEKEKEFASSEAVGGTSGKLVGSAVGMIVGGLVGSLAGPGGAFIGASIGSSVFAFLGEKGGELLGRWRAENGEKQKADTKGHYAYTGVNGLPVWVEPHIPVANLPPQITQTKMEIPPQQVALEGQAVMDVTVKVSDERPAAQVTVRNNSMHHRRYRRRLDDTMSFDASLPTAYADDWRKAERPQEDHPRLSTYQAPGGSPLVFILEGFDFSGGQSVDTAEYPLGGLWSNERLNEKPQVLHIQGFLRGPEYIKQRNTLIASLRVSTSDDTPGFIGLPFWGRFPVVVTDYRIAEKTNEKGQCSVSIDCKRAGVSSTERTEADFPRATTTSAVKALQEAVIGDIKIRLKDTLDTNTLVQGFAKVRSTLLTVLGRVQAAQTLLNTITSTINDLSNLIAQGIRAPDEFAGAFFRAIASIFGGLLEIKNSFDIYSVSRSGSIYPDPNNTENSMSSYPYPADTNEKNMLLQFLGASTYTLNMQAATAPKRATQEAIEQCYRIGALCVASQIIVQMEGISYQTAQGYWNLLQKLEASIDKDNPVVYAAIEELRISVSGELAVKELSAEIHRTFTSPLPLLAMAQYVGCNADKLRERNRVADSFVLTGEVVYV